MMTLHNVQRRPKLKPHEHAGVVCRESENLSKSGQFN